MSDSPYLDPISAKMHGNIYDKKIENFYEENKYNADTQNKAFE